MSERFEKEAAGQAFGGSPLDYRNRAYTFLDVLCNDRDFSRAHSYLDPDCVLIHADNPPVRGARRRGHCASAATRRLTIFNS